MPNLLPILLILIVSFGLIAMGLWQLLTPLDTLWERHERFLLARGSAPRRNEVWEQNARRGGWLFIGMGVLMAVFVILVAASTPPKMSGVSIDGRELTQAEWDACGRDMPTCLTMEAIRRR